MELGHLLTRSGLTYPEVSSKVYHDSLCQLVSSISLPWVIYFEAFCLHVVSSVSCIPVICPELVLFLIPLQIVYLFCNLSQVYPAVLLMYFISAAVILLASLALIAQVSLPYNKTGRASVLYSFIIIIIFMYCNWVVTRWQRLFYMYFISAAVILLASLALIVQVSLYIYIYIYTVLFEMIVVVLTTCHKQYLVLQMQPHVISFYGVTSRIRFMSLLFPQVSRN